MLIDVLISLALAGLFLWVLGQVDFIDAGIKKLMRIVVIVAVCLYLIGVFTGHAPGIYSGPYWRK